MTKVSIVMYKDHLLPVSETFILNQGESLFEYSVYYAGYREVKGIATPSNRTFVVNKKKGTQIGTFFESLFIRYGLSPYLYRKFKQIKPKLVHAHFGIGAAAALLFVKRMKLPLVVTYHGFDATTKDEFAKNSYFGHRLYLNRRSELINYASQFIAVSNFIKTKMIEQGIPDSKIVVHYTGIRLDMFQPDMSVEREPIVLFVGRLVEQKGCYNLLNAMKQVQEHYSNCKVVIIGEGPQRTRLEEFARLQKLNCIFLGSIPYDEVKLWMNKSMILSVPSIKMESGAEEGMGMVFIEANAMGLPVVSTRTGGIPEAVVHNETGLLVDEGDIDKLAESINRLLSDSALWFRMSKNGIERARAKFDINKQSMILQGIYKKVINRETEDMT